MRERFVEGLFVLAVTAGVAIAVSAEASGRPLPAPVTLGGVGGMEMGMNSRQVQHISHGTRIGVHEGTSASIYIPICAGSMHGVAVLFGPDAVLTDRSGDSLETIWFSSDARTARGVGVGSTRSQVVRAYGSRLESYGANLYLVGKPVELFKDTFVRPAIWFAFNRNRVRMLAYGGLQWLKGGFDAPRRAREACR